MTISASERRMQRVMRWEMFTEPELRDMLEAWAMSEFRPGPAVERMEVEISAELERRGADDV